MTEQELIEWVADMWNQRASGKTFETLGPFGWKHNNYGPNVDSHTSEWRMKPEVKVIDLSPMLESGLDCEFFNDKVDGKFYGLLHSIVPTQHPYALKNRGRFENCQPRMTPYIHYWAGSDKCPVPEGFEVRLHFREGHSRDTETKSLNDLRWKHDGRVSYDIIGIEFTGIKDGYTLGGDKQ